MRDGEAVPLFSKVFYENVLTDDLDFKNITNIVSQQEFKVSRSIVQPEDNLTESTTCFDLLENKNLKVLKDKILSEFCYFKNKFLRYEKIDFGLTTSWATKSEPNECSNLHNHTNCFYSGIFYLSVNDESGDIFFVDYTDNRIGDLTIDDYNIFNSKSWQWTPKKGMLIFFPSSVYHRILRNESSKTRYSIAFNFMPLGVIGDGDSQFIYK